jgi:N-acetylmuramoyl-L-alanine amidase
MLVVISSGHGRYVRGATGLIDEVTEARKVVSRVVELLEDNDVEVVELHDDVSTSQSANLEWIVSHHNDYPSSDRLDLSVHFNAYVYTEGGRGTESLFISDQGEVLADEICTAISQSTGLINRGPHYRPDLYFLNGTTGSLGAVLIECCFVDAQKDVELYSKYFEQLCSAIVRSIVPHEVADTVRGFGTCSTFGGPADTGVSPSEGIALEDHGVTPENPDKAHLFMPHQPPSTTGLARRLNAEGSFYFACRFDYDNPLTTKDKLGGNDKALVRNRKTGKHALAEPVDWGPHASLGRFTDLSPALAREIEAQTDVDEVEIIYPWRE